MIRRALRNRDQTVRLMVVGAALAVAGTSLSSQSTTQKDHAAAAAELHQAVAVAQEGHPDRALPLVRELLVKHPKYAPGFKFEGALLQDMGQAAAAETCFEQALKLAPTDSELLFEVGVNRLAAGKYEEAMTLLQRGAREAPRDGEMLYYLAQAYHLHGDDELALKTIGKSVQLEPGNAAILQKNGELLTSAGNGTEAMEWLTKAQKLDPSLDRLGFDMGVASFRNEDLEAAAQYAKRAVAEHPNDAKALELSAEVEAKLSDWQDAKDAFERLLAINPEDATALLGLGRSELGLKDYQASVSTLQKLLQQAPTTILAHFYLARAYAGLGMKAEAAHETDLHNKLVEEAASVVPADEREVEKATLLEARQMLADGHESEAVKLFRQRSKGPGATPGAPMMLVGVSYLYMGRPQDADRCLKQAIAMEPKVRLAHTYLGLLAMQRQDLVEAERQFNLELSQDPNSQLAVAELGEVRYRQGRWDDAATLLARSRTVSPALLYLLSDAYFHLNKVHDADLTAELAVDYGKDDPELVQQVVALLARNQQTELAQKLVSK